jgi:hypothetical protein
VYRQGVEVLVLGVFLEVRVAVDERAEEEKGVGWDGIGHKLDKSGTNHQLGELKVEGISPVVKILYKVEELVRLGRLGCVCDDV